MDRSVTFAVANGHTEIGNTLEIVLSAANPLSSAPSVVQFDNVRLTYTAQVPEPGTCSLLTACVIGLLAYAWRKRR